MRGSPLSGLRYGFLALLLLGSVAWPASSQGKTFYLKFRFYCHSNPATTGVNACGVHASEDDLKKWVLDNVAELNLHWKPNQISFRPLPPVIVYDEDYSRIDATLDPQTPENLVKLQDLRDLAATEPQVVTLFEIEDLKSNFSVIAGYPDPNDPPNYVRELFCAPSLGGGDLWAHELGHHFGLTHTFVDYKGGLLDPFEAVEDGVAYTANGDGLDCTLSDPGGIEDTADPNDPNNPDSPYDDRDSNGMARPDFKYCEFFASDEPSSALPPVDAGSPLQRYCTGLCKENLGPGEVPIFEPPPVANAMSYYFCQGPYVVAGLRHEAFCGDQRTRIETVLATVSARKDLSDVCAIWGGDTDLDGRCNTEDNCPSKANLHQYDDDLDGIGNTCDLCPNLVGGGGDADGDGVGNGCDPDIDNDGCLNAADQNPMEAKIPAGAILHAGCADEILYGFEGLDSDADGALNCAEDDDDNDGIKDDSDECPLQAQQNCEVQGPACSIGNIPAWQVTCNFGSCGEFDLVLEEVSNPDPTFVLGFEKFEAVNGVLYIFAVPGRTLSETGRLLQPGRAETKSLRLRDKTNGRLMATIAEFEADELVLGDLGRGGVLRVAPSLVRGSTSVTATYAIGTAEGEPQLDGDGDTVPAASDNCTEAENLAQADADRDKVGDHCDPDLDNDGLVTDLDVQKVVACKGIDLRVRAPVFELGFTMAQPPLPPGGLVRRQLCAPVDFNGDRLVDDLDVGIAMTFLGRAPGPSGLSEAQATPTPVLAVLDSGPPDHLPLAWVAAVLGAVFLIRSRRRGL